MVGRRGSDPEPPWKKMTVPELAMKTITVPELLIKKGFIHAIKKV